MAIEHYPLNLQLLANSEIATKYWEAGSKELIIERARQLHDELSSKRRRSALWRFSIPSNHPLKFKISEENGLKLKVDIYCELEGRGDDIDKHCVVLRVWSIDENISFRENLDSNELRNTLEASDWTRVMMRFHMDKRAQTVTKPEPYYHLHAGGLQGSDEFCWLHDRIEIPRFNYPPIDIVLLCELILVNFFSDESEDLRKKPEWRSLVRKSQDLFQRDYFYKCNTYLSDDSSTLLEKCIEN